MGYNTSVVILNDGLHFIEKDPNFGKNLAKAISGISTQKYLCEQDGKPFYGIDVPSLNHCNAATVIETHHADATSLVAFGGNMGQMVMGPIYYLAHSGDDFRLRILKQLAAELGYSVRKNGGK